MKRIGIFTFSWANNYGAMLQCYALKYTFINIGENATVINYTPKQSNNRLIKNLIFWPWALYLKYKFHSFSKTYLTDMPLLKRKDLPTLNDKFDCFVAGSDQVWNMLGSNHDTSYLLDFVKDNNKKYSYAASFGRVDIPQAERTLLQTWIKLFKEISVRETTSLSLARELSGKEARVNIDPTLLLKKEDWQKISILPKESGYIVLYLMNRNEKIVNFAKDLSKRTGLKIIFISTSPVSCYGIKPICPSPQEWLGYFLNADYTITNSFHGLAFSINFNKNFFANLQPAPSKGNTRLESLLDLTSLRARLIDNGANENSPTPDWTAVNSVLGEEREKSLNYLRGIAGDK